MNKTVSIIIVLVLLVAVVVGAAKLVGDRQQHVNEQKALIEALDETAKKQQQLRDNPGQAEPRSGPPGF